jgi:hypothetical protein
MSLRSSGLHFLIALTRDGTFPDGNNEQKSFRRFFMPV